MHRAREGETRFFDELVARYADRVHRLTYKILRHEQDAEDAMQDAFLSAYRSLPRFQEKSTFSTWLYRIATNAALMRLRKRREGMVSLKAAAGAISRPLCRLPTGRAPRSKISWTPNSTPPWKRR